MGPPVLLNIDLGELPDEPAALYEYAHIANVACGVHAGDTASIRRAVARCNQHGTRLGAHPSYPDRSTFGRVRVEMSFELLRDLVGEQCERLARLAAEDEAAVRFVKPHGALYHAAAEDESIAEATLAGITQALGNEVTVIGPPRGALRAAVGRRAVAYAPEGFADRAVRADGSLVPRSEPGALLLEPATAARRARELAAAGGIATVCVHGDTPGAVAIAEAVRSALGG